METVLACHRDALKGVLGGRVTVLVVVVEQAVDESDGSVSVMIHIQSRHLTGPAGDLSSNCLE